ncbi:UDP-N-acetylmuramoylalanyl-D-glutamate--2,6-diaminopimelate ligase [Candidatus Ruthia magnifica str. Cm (Calyptogena magnifica)]|uniref:UDP-N-acetylmuramoyl-L-alanyl-D-glutamate--2,6-diaminopimelate ligase n=1 Tax=Ruthia magnifica subsp. Calyptogena magnifica TaxID=413404 RepID=A1AVJ0_RUTMC|nr:UDP-N-acetylmuramoyl-L-alanyl-D-glutamate--2,6-diaminopimelate ligase [Candidatus Ruthturnera calyptogenae]ABL01947.1 UDP-N-acetylmuramoylalanyl-D-glutamate--2,6-diaminopimelate ligase [Candidatus Ruthia magnifica str. Cm (Calyptogena magnifica)]
MNISQLLANIVQTKIDIEIKGLCLNAQSTQPGDLFIALQGKLTHGADYINQAIDKGCVAILVDSKEIECVIPSIRIDNLSQYLQTLANTFYKNAIKVNIISITGTNGKTSVAYFISQLLTKLGIKNGLIGTLGITHSQQLSLNTTPDILTLYQVLDNYYQNNIHHAILEVSSHALTQDRIAGLNIKQAIFTNLTQDHLDYHHTLDKYQATKEKLFVLDTVESVILNQDDSHYKHFLNITKDKKRISYSLGDFDSIKTIEQGFLVQLDHYVFEIPFLGEFNLLNILAALNSVEALGFKRDDIIPLFYQLLPPPGRMQRIEPHLAWIDYAHTPDAIGNAITTLKKHYPNFKIRIVFGCGGNRDKDKRAEMGKIASNLADTIILTNDNPRSENPKTIIENILSGIDDSYKLDIIENRQLAIETAITTLKENECLLIAGKGHETIQQFSDKTIYLNDLEIAQNSTKAI